MAKKAKLSKEQEVTNKFTDGKISLYQAVLEIMHKDINLTKCPTCGKCYG